MTTPQDIPRRVRLFNIDIDSLTMDQAVRTVFSWVEPFRSDPANARCRLVVTPNVDHAVLLNRHAGLRQAYAVADLVLADGAPVVLASRLLGRPLPQRVAGSDLVPALFDAAGGLDTPLRVFLLGGACGVPEKAAANIMRKWAAVRCVGTLSPPLGFHHDPQQNEQILAEIERVQPDLVLAGLGAPKQELWTAEHRLRIRAAGVLCVGATIDFLAGQRARAPYWMRVTGTEWLHRLASEPRRLAGRYLRDAVEFPCLVWREWRTQGRGMGA